MPGHQPERLASQKNAKSQARDSGCHGNLGACLPGDLVPREGAGLEGCRANEAEGTAGSEIRCAPGIRGGLIDMNWAEPVRAREV